MAEDINIKINITGATDAVKSTESVTKALNQMVAANEKVAKSSKAKTTENKKATEAAKAEKAVQKQLLSSNKALNKQRESAAKAVSKQVFKQFELEEAAQKEIHTVEDLKAQLKATIKLREQLDTTTEEGIQQNKEYEQSILDLKQAVADSNEAIKLQADEVYNSKQEMDEMAGSAGQLLGGLGAVTGAVILLGDDGSASMEELQENMNKAMGVMMGVRGAVEVATGAMKLWVPVQKALNAAMKANPAGVYATAILAVVAAIGLLIYKMNDQTKLQKDLIKSSRDATVQYKQEQRQMNDLFEELKNTNEGSDERLYLIEQMNSEYGEYLPNLFDEKTSLDDITIAQNAANDALARKILLAAKETAITEALNDVYADQVDAVNKIKEEVEDWGGTLTTQNAVVKEFTKLVNEGSSANRAFQLATERAGLGAISLPSSGIERQVLSLYDSLIEAKDIMDEVSSSYDVLIDSFQTPTRTGATPTGGGSGAISEAEATAISESEALERQYLWNIKIVLQINEREKRQKAMLETTLAYQNSVVGLYQNIYLEQGYLDDQQQHSFDSWQVNIKDTETELINLEKSIARSGEAIAEMTETSGDLFEELAKDIGDANREALKRQELIDAANLIGKQQIEDAGVDMAATAAQKKLEIEEERIAAEHELEQENLNNKHQLQQDQLQDVSDARKEQMQIEGTYAASQADLQEKQRNLQIRQDAAQAALEKKQAREQHQIKVKSAVADGVISLTQIGIDTARAVSLVTAQTGVLAPFAIPGVIASGVAQAVAVAAGVAQIASQKFAKGGVLNGPSHAEGGIKTPYGELEGEEGIINKVSMGNPNLRALASVANVAGGGVGFSGQAPQMDINYNLLAEKLGNVINTQKVVVSQNDITRTQKKVQVIENKSTF